MRQRWLFLMATYLVIVLQLHFVSGFEGEGDWYDPSGKSLMLHLKHKNVRRLSNMHSKLAASAASVAAAAAAASSAAGAGAAAAATSSIPMSPNARKAGYQLNTGREEKSVSKLDSVKVLYFCENCLNPDEEGSVAHGLLNFFMIANWGGSSSSLPFDVTAEAVYVVPNHAEGRITNSEQLLHRIALVRRGKSVALGHKVVSILKAQPMVKGVVIIDDSQCDDEFRYCGHRAGSAFEGGFSPYDNVDIWELALSLKVPVLLVTARTGERFNSMMLLKKVKRSRESSEDYMTMLPLPHTQSSRSRGFEDAANSSGGGGNSAGSRSSGRSNSDGGTTGASAGGASRATPSSRMHATQHQHQHQHLHRDFVEDAYYDDYYYDDNYEL